jgi:hypothetical protein
MFQIKITKNSMRIEKRTFAKRDGNERFIEPQHFVVSNKKLSKVAGFKSTVLKAIKSHEDIEENLKIKLKKVFSDGLKKLPKQKDLVSKGYKLESLAGEKVIKLSTILNKKGEIKKWGDLSVLYVHNFLTEGFDTVLGQHPKYPEEKDKTAIYLKK